jgi:hypothetical protein
MWRMMRLNSRTTVPLLGAALLAVAGCDCDPGSEVDAGAPIDANVPIDAFTPVPEITITPALQDFGDVVVGQTSTASEFTIENVGTGATGRLSAVFGGADPGDFSFASNTCAGMSLDVGDTCTVSVEFRPGAEGGSSATLTVGDGDAEATATLEGNGAADAGLAISPTPHNFGDAIIGTPSAPQVFTVTNTGDATSGTINITLSGLDATQFELGADSCSGMTVAAGDDCTVEVIYNPTASGVHMGTLQATASPGSTATAALQGRAASAASVRLLPGSQDFGTVVTGSSSSTVDFTLTNTGGVPTGTISHTFGGADAAEFSVTSSTCAGAPLAGGASCTITVRFNAASAGAKTATLDVTDGTLTASATLSANGVAPGAIVIEPSTRDYGNSSIGVATGATTFTVRNTGGAATGVLTVAVAGTNPADFPIVAGGDGCSGATLAAMGTCTIAVQFNPTAAGARAATLRVQGTPGGTATSALTGTGESAAAIEVTPTAADFGSVATGSSSSLVSFTVRNTGGASTGVPTVAITGVQATQFTVVSNGCTASIAGGATCTVTVRFSPTTTGAKTARLDVSATPGGTDSSDLSGTGITPVALTLTPSAASYGMVAETTSATRTFTVQNTGMETVTALSFAVSAGGPEFAVVTGAGTTCGATLAGMSSCTIEVAFTPNQGTTAAAGTLTVMGTPGGTLTSALSATGIPDLLITPPMMNAFTTANSSTGVIVGATASNTYTVTNQTGRALTALTVASPTGMMEFTRTGGSCMTSLAVGASCTVIIQFAPTGTAGARSVNLTVTASGGATETFGITGTARGALRWLDWQAPGGAVTAFAVPTAGPATYGDRAIGSFYDMTLTLRNEHTAASALITMAPTFTGDMNLQNDLCTGTTLAAGTNCTVRVRFYPRATGAATGALVVTQGGNTATANITANGVTGASITVTGSPDFGRVIATTTLDRTFTVTNTGSQPTGNLNVPAVGTVGTRYAVTATTCAIPAAPLAAGGTCTITVRYSPSQADSTTAAQTGTFNVSQGAQTITTNLTGLVDSQLTLTPATAAFTTGVGTTSATTRFTVTNRGTTATGSITVAAGSFAANFPITNNTCATLAPAATCTFDVAFAPTANVDRTGVEIRASNGAYVANVARVAVSTVSGDARSPAILTLVPNFAGTFQFGDVADGQNSAPHTFTVRNSGDLASGPLTASIVAAPVGACAGYAGGSTTDFWDITASTCTGALAAGSSCTVTIRHSPPTGSDCGGAAFRTATFRVTDGTSTMNQTIGAWSNDIQNLFPTPSNVDFGNAVIGTTTATMAITVANSATTSRTITTAPASTANFQVTGNTCTVGTVVMAGGTCSFNVAFRPVAPAGSKQEIISVNAGGIVMFFIPNGFAQNPAALSLTPADVATEYPGTVVGQTSTITYTVANTGGVATAMAPAISLGGADPGQYSIANNTCTAALAASGTAAASCTFDVVFAPTSAGVKTVHPHASTLVVTATASRTLAGTGIGAALLGISPSAPQTCPARAAGTGNNDGQICTVYTITNGGGSPSQPLSIGVTGDFRIETATSSCVQDPAAAAGAVGSAITTAGPATVTGRVINDTGGPACDTAGSGATTACGATCTVVVQHVPQSVGADSGTLTVGASGIASVTGTISSSGISAFQHSATTPAAFTEGTVSFGTFAVGAVTGSNQIITFLNRTAPATSVMTYTITGTNAADFDMQSDSCSGGTFGRGLGCATTIRFLPSAVGARTATLTVTDGTPEHTAVITLNGTGS